MPKAPRSETDMLADRAFERWEARDLAAAAELYAQVVAAPVDDNYNFPRYLGAYAAVLAELGRHAEARAAYERSVTCELDLGNDETSAPVAVARYFLGEHAIRTSDPTRALESIAPSMETTTKLRAMLHLIKAEACMALGETEQARAAALVALSGASSAEQRSRIADRLAKAGLPPDAVAR